MNHKSTDTRCRARCEALPTAAQNPGPGVSYGQTFGVEPANECPLLHPDRTKLPDRFRPKAAVRPFAESSFERERALRRQKHPR
jgi:hypothetical protein